MGALKKARLGGWGTSTGRRTLAEKKKSDADVSGSSQWTEPYAIPDQKKKSGKHRPPARQEVQKKKEKATCRLQGKKSTTNAGFCESCNRVKPTEQSHRQEGKEKRKDVRVPLRKENNLKESAHLGKGGKTH